MTKDEALKMAINELEAEWPSVNRAYAVKACKEALEQPAQEPVEVYGILDDGDYVSVEATKEGAIKQCEFMNKHDCNCTYKPLYTRHTPAQEPYGWYDNHDIHSERQSNESIALYTHPHQWQGLTDDVVASIWMHEAVPMNGQDFKRVYRAIEQALKEKNT
jgi:hypothetical protein